MSCMYRNERFHVLPCSYLQYYRLCSNAEQIYSNAVLALPIDNNVFSRTLNLHGSINKVIKFFITFALIRRNMDRYKYLSKAKLPRRIQKVKSSKYESFEMIHDNKIYWENIFNDLSAPAKGPVSKICHIFYYLCPLTQIYQVI